MIASDGDAHRAALQHAVVVASLFCLLAASAVGLWLALVLIWPEAGALLGPLTYGRWMPVHLDLQLFGWCSLPIVGVLMLRMLPLGDRWIEAARLALAAWLGALVAGSLHWLGGHTSGKIFLDWSGAAGLAFAGAQILLWLVLAAGWWARRRDPDSRVSRVVDAGVLLLLAAVPFVLQFSAQPSVYPPVNPDSGGATGHSLLASSLGLVGIALALPPLLGRSPRRPIFRSAIAISLVFAGNWAFYLSIGHGNATHHDVGQVVGLGTLLVWPLLLPWWFRRFTWESTQRRWLITTAIWTAAIVLDGFALFLPGVLDALKFTNAFVAHSHLAMAGLLTSLNLLLLISLAPSSALSRALDARLPWSLWNGGAAAMILVLTWVGLREMADPFAIWNGTGAVTHGYAMRLVAGAVMFGAAGLWMRSAMVVGARRHRSEGAA